MHENYMPSTVDNDIALLQLAVPISYTMYAIPACLPTRPLAERELWAVSLHTVSGWGRRSEDGPTSHLLRQLKVPRIRTQQCKEDSGVPLTQNMFCAGYIEGRQDSCKGDSGGPLVTKYKNTVFLLGIVSWGKGCAQPGNYGIYTRVSNYLEWIHNRTTTFNQLTNDTENATTWGPESTTNEWKCSFLVKGKSLMRFHYFTVLTHLLKPTLEGTLLPGQNEQLLCYVITFL